MPASFQTSPTEILQQVLNIIRSRFDYAHIALTCRAVFSAASDKALLRRWFIRYMQNQYFMLYDGHPKPVRGAAMEALDGPGAEALGYSFRDAIRLNELCDGCLFHENYWDELYFQNGFLPHAVSFLESCVLDGNCKSYKELPVSDRRFVQRFLRTANKPRPFTAVTTLLSGEWYDTDDLVEQPAHERPGHRRLKYMALNTFGRVFDGTVHWKVHLPGGLTLIDADGFGSIYKTVSALFSITSRHWVNEGELKLDLGPELRRGDKVRIGFQIHEDLSADLTIRRRPEFMERVEFKVTLGLKVTFHSIVWTRLEEESAEEESAEGRLAEEELAEEELVEQESDEEDLVEEESAEEESAGDETAEEEAADDESAEENSARDSLGQATIA
ncbi:hypothetical protein HK104_001581 [Borealophlyctis nickersoniae]|nr:hypothetical protein HK104_001581 [Borealophlyctis nickersoniae]